MSCWSTPSEEPGYEPSMPPDTSTCIDVLAILIEGQDEDEVKDRVHAMHSFDRPSSRRLDMERL